MSVSPISDKALPTFISSWAAHIDEINGETADMLGLLRGERAIQLTAVREHLNNALRALKQLKEL